MAKAAYAQVGPAYAQALLKSADGRP